MRTLRLRAFDVIEQRLGPRRPVGRLGPLEMAGFWANTDTDRLPTEPHKIYEQMALAETHARIHNPLDTDVENLLRDPQERARARKEAEDALCNAAIG